MQNTAFRFGPVYLGSTAANILNPGTTINGTIAGVAFQSSVYANLYIILRHILIVNTDGTAHTFSLYIGASAGSSGGTNFWGYQQTIAANSYAQWYGYLRLDTGEYLTGLASASSLLVINGEGEVGVAAAG